MDPSIITLIVNIVFYSIIGLIFIKSLFGLIRGTWKSLNSYIISIACYAVIILLNGKIAEAVYNINLYSLGMVVQVEDQTIMVTTIGQTIRDVIIALSGENTGLTSNSEIFVVCDALAQSILSLVVFIIDFILVAFIIAPLLSLIFYHSVFKFIVGRKKIKEKNAGLRLGGFGISMVKAIVTSALFIMPFSAIATQISTAVKEYDFENDENAKLFNSYVDAYSNSSLAKLMTGISVNGTAVDVTFTQYITNAKMGKDTVSFVEELGTFVDIACKGVEEGVIDMNEFTVNYANLLGKEFITYGLQKISSSKLVTTLLPIALNIVVNLDEIKNYVDLTEVDWLSIDWTDELTALSDIYEVFYDTGIMEKYVINQEDFMDYSISRNDYYGLHQTFDSLKKSQVLNDVMPYLFVSFEKYLEDNNSDFAGIFPTEVEAYSDINISDELSNIYDSLLTISDICSYSSLNRNMCIRDLSDENTRNTIIDFLLSSDAVYGSEHIVSTDNNKLPLTTLSAFSGVYDDKNIQKYGGLLDSKLLMENLGNIMGVLTKNEKIKEFGVEDAIVESGELLKTKEDWTKELDSLLSILPIVYNNPNFNPEKFDYYDQAQVDELKRLKPYINDSVIVNKMAEPIFKYLVKENNLELPYGLDVSSFNFKCDKLGDELCNLLDVLPKIGNIQKALQKGPSGFFDKTLFDVSSLNSVFTSIYESKIINNSTPANELSNFETVLLNVFQEEAVVSLGIEVDEELLLSIRNSPTSTRSSDGWTTEISSICNALSVLQSSKSFKTIVNKVDSNTEISIKDVNGDEFYNVFDAFISSTLFQHSIGSVMNTLLNESLQQMNLDLDFQVVEDWRTEIDNFRDVINIVNGMSDHGFDLANINISSLDYTDVDENGVDKTGVDDLEQVIKSVYKLQCIQNEIVDGQPVKSDRFGKFVYDNITSKFFESYINQDNQELIFNDHLLKIDANGELVDVPLNESSMVVWGDIDGNDGEIENLMDLVDFIMNDKTEIDSNGDGRIDETRKTFFSEGTDGQLTLDLNTGINNSEKLHSLLTRVDNIYPFRTLLGEIIEQSITESSSSFVIKGIDLSLIHTSLFKSELSMDIVNSEAAIKIENREQEIEAREKEISGFVAIYDDILKLNDALVDDSTGEWNTSMTNIGPEVDTISSLLNNLASSNMFNVENAGKDKTFFEEIMIYFLNQSGVSKMMVKEESKAEEFAKAAVTSIDNLSPSNNNWIGEKGEIALFIDAVKTATNSKLAPLFEANADANTLMNNIEGTEISSLVKKLSYSNVINYENALGNILDNQLGPVFDYEKTGLYVQFDKVENWDAEADNIGGLIDSIKAFSGDNFSFDIDIATIDSVNAETMLHHLYALEAVQKAVDINGKTLEDNFGDFVYNKLTKQAFDKYIVSQDEAKLLFDHHLKVSTYGSWNDEISKIKDLIDLIQSKDNNGNYIYLIQDSEGKNTINSNSFGENKENLNGLLTNINKLDIYRSLMVEIINQEFNNVKDVQVEDLDFSKINISLFNNEYNFLSEKGEVKTRQAELEIRQLEINKVTDIYGLILDLQGSFDTLGPSVIVNDAGEETETSKQLFILLNDMNNSRLFTKVVDGTSFFEDFVKLILLRTGIVPMMNKGVVSDDEYALMAVKSIDNKKLPWNTELNLMEDALVKMARLKNLFTSTTQDLSSLNTDDIACAISAIGRSHLFNYENSLGTILNKNIKPSFDGTDLLVDFENVGIDEATRVDEWDIEGENVAKLFQSIKDVNGGSLSFDFDLSGLSEEKLDGFKNILTNLHDLLSVQKTTRANEATYKDVDNFGYFIYKNATSKMFSAYINSTNEGLVLTDHNLDGIDYLYNEGTIVSWTDTNLEDSYKGDIDELIECFKFANKTLYSENGTYDVSHILDLSQDNLKTLFAKFNNISCVRTVLGELIAKQIADNSNTVVSMKDNVYTDLFKYEFNFLNTSTENGKLAEVSCRLGEINARQKELDLLADIFSNMKILNESIGGNTDLSGFDISEVDNITETLLLLHNSRIFNSAKVKASHTFFEDVVKYVLDSTTLSDMIYDEKYDLDSGKSPIGRDNKVYQVISNVSGNVDNQSWTLINNSNSILDLGDSTLGRLDVLLRSLCKITDESGNKVSNVNEINNLSSKSVKDILDCLNRCYITHDAVSKLVESVFTTSINLNDEFILEGTPKIYGRYIDSYIDSLDGNFGDKVSTWSKDIELLTTLYENMKQFNNGLSGAIDGNSGQIGEGAFVKTLPYIGQMKTVELQRADIIYSTFKKAKVDKYVTTYTGSKNDGADLKKRDLIAYLIDKKIITKTTNTAWNDEAIALDKLTNLLLANSDSSLDGTNKISSDTAYNIINATYAYSKDLVVTDNNYEQRYTRYYLASELVSTFIVDLASSVNVTFTHSIKNGIRGNIIYSYEGLNRLEAEGLKGVIDLADNVTTYYNAVSSTNAADISNFNYDNWWNNEFSVSAKSIGSKDDAEERFFYLGNNHYNALIAISLYSSIMSDEITDINALIDSTNTAIDAYNALNGTSYEKITPVERWIPNEDEDFFTLSKTWDTTLRQLYEARLKISA